jgi:8-oxo-dGTP pyrophosphatase MutT (NUDIX family)
MAPRPRIPDVREDHVRRAFALEGFDARKAQQVMEPAFRGDPPRSAAAAPPRDAAALLYVYPGARGLSLPLTLRRDDLPEHRGQVSLPGGRPANGEALWDTALREASEEIGLRGDGLERVGVLEPVYIPVTHTRLLVHVALGPDPGPLVPEAREVARLVPVRVVDLLDPARRHVDLRSIRGRAVTVPSFFLEGLDVWGATAMALSDFSERLRQTL